MAEDLRAKLTGLKELLDLGLLTEAEFQEQKAALLASSLGTTPAPAGRPLGGATSVAPPEPVGGGPLGGATFMAPPEPVGGGPLGGATTVDPAAGLPSQVGNYRILGLIGAGGMGTVVRARHLEEGWARRQGGDVALKLIHPHIAQDPTFRERFLDEAQLGRRVQHPALATVYDVVVEGPWLGTVMALVEGDSLERLVEPGGMPLAQALVILRPLAAALDHLHAQGIVHRDLKPANIKVRPDRSPVILDLGIAKDLKSGADHTQTMTAMGTTRWMAPEQADAKHIGPAADRYALGLITCALLTGGLPWGPDLSELRIVTLKMTGNLVPVARLKPDLPGGAVAAVTAMLALDPEARPGSCAAFVAALEGGEGLAAPAPEPNPTDEPAGLGVASLGQLLLYAAWRQDAPAMGGWSRAQVLAVLAELERSDPRWATWEVEQAAKATERSAQQQRVGRARLLNLLHKYRGKVADEEIEAARRRAEAERAQRVAAEQAARQAAERVQAEAAERQRQENAERARQAAAAWEAARERLRELSAARPAMDASRERLTRASNLLNDAQADLDGFKGAGFGGFFSAAARERARLEREELEAARDRAREAMQAAKQAHQALLDARTARVEIVVAMIEPHAAFLSEAQKAQLPEDVREMLGWGR
ncbi:MAG: serine/threonine-protein kinase [Pseudomonadota bacterium]